MFERFITKEQWRFPELAAHALSCFSSHSKSNHQTSLKARSCIKGSQRIVKQRQFPLWSEYTSAVGTVAAGDAVFCVFLSGLSLSTQQ